MSETIQKVLLSELQKVRIICNNPNCGAILETPLADLGRFLPNGTCRYCNTDLMPGNENTLLTLANAIHTLNAAAKRVVVEFVLPVKPEAK